MTEIDKPRAKLTLIECDRSELERRLLELLCSMPLEEFEKAVAKLTSRATLRLAEGPPKDPEDRHADQPK